MGEASRMMKQQRALVATMPANPLGTPTADTPTATNSLQVNQQLGLNQYRTSTSGKFRVYLQGDGNLVLYNSSGAPLWATDTSGLSFAQQ